MYLFLWLSNFLIQLCGLRLLHGRFACFLVNCFRFCFSFFVLLLLFSFFLSSSLFFRLTSCFFLLTERFFLLTARFLLLRFLSVTRILLKMSTLCKTILLTSEKNKQGHFWDGDFVYTSACLFSLISFSLCSLACRRAFSSSARLLFSCRNQS